jgi:hypothetical protein
VWNQATQTGKTLLHATALLYAAIALHALQKKRIQFPFSLLGLIASPEIAGHPVALDGIKRFVAMVAASVTCDCQQQGGVNRELRTGLL